MLSPETRRFIASRRRLPHRDIGCKAAFISILCMKLMRNDIECKYSSTLICFSFLATSFCTFCKIKIQLNGWNQETAVFPEKKLSTLISRFFFLHSKALTAKDLASRLFCFGYLFVYLCFDLIYFILFYLFYIPFSPPSNSTTKMIHCLRILNFLSFTLV